MNKTEEKVNQKNKEVESSPKNEMKTNSGKGNEKLAETI